MLNKQRAPSFQNPGDLILRINAQRHTMAIIDHFFTVIIAIRNAQAVAIFFLHAPIRKRRIFDRIFGQDATGLHQTDPAVDMQCNFTIAVLKKLCNCAGIILRQKFAARKIDRANKMRQGNFILKYPIEVFNRLHTAIETKMRIACGVMWFLQRIVQAIPIAGNGNDDFCHNSHERLR
ncbi:hypothetical protein KJ068_06460 [bacterium]|nr:hypothetical protein [bacterium]